MHYATSWKVAGSRADEANIFNLPYNYSGPGVYSVSNRNEYEKQKVEGGRCLGLTVLPTT
jgi:hypothetical protein